MAKKEQADPHERVVAQREQYENQKEDRSMGTNAGLSSLGAGNGWDTSGAGMAAMGGHPNFN